MLHVRINVPARPRALEALAEGLVRLNVWYITKAAERGVDLPALYDSGVVYRREPPGQEWWESAHDVLSFVTQRSGDCEDLAAYRAAELRYFEGVDAFVRVIRTKRGTFHAIVEYPDGTREDPSRELVNIEREAQASKAA